MRTPKISNLIVNSPYREPEQHWQFDRELGDFELRKGRRSAGYVIAGNAKGENYASGTFAELPLVNVIRERVSQWRKNGYPGTTGVTQRLLRHWTETNDSNLRQFFFAQIEAIETLIWMRESHPSVRTGIELPTDGGPFPRLCAKMATGTGKTIVMAMLIAWQTLNDLSRSQRNSYTRNFLIVAPGLTVKNRLKVLDPQSKGNYYEEFSIVPVSMFASLRSARVVIHNWHKLAPESTKSSAKKSVVKLPQMGDRAFAKQILGNHASHSNWIVINDEAHHAWRLPEGSNTRKVMKPEMKSELKNATIWINGLDRIHRTKKIETCYDFSATPFAPITDLISESLYGWIVSDFGLNDAIESGLVKTPRVVVKDDGTLDSKTFRSKLYHIFSDEEVKSNLNLKLNPEIPLPSLVHSAYALLGSDWRETAQLWRKHNLEVPPVMITVANTTETAARIKYAFDHNNMLIEELCDPSRTLHIDSKVLEKAEKSDIQEKETKEKKTNEEVLRQMVNTVGQQGEVGAGICNIISVGMLSEGWDAKTVTHIMGLRAFSSQLLCEQVVGRGLRRTSYEINNETGLFDAEYVNVFGIPFSFLPHESQDGPGPGPAEPKIEIRPVPEKARFALQWPNVERFEPVYSPILKLHDSRLDTLELDASKTPLIAELAPIVDGEPDTSKIDEIANIDLRRLALEKRTQTLIFESASVLFTMLNHEWNFGRGELISQLILIVQRFMKSSKIVVIPDSYDKDEERKKLVILLNLDRVTQHIKDAIELYGTKRVDLVFDQLNPIGSTADMPSWFSGKKYLKAEHCHINYCVCDSSWEARVADVLMSSKQVTAWAKNDHLGFELKYVSSGVVKRYIPDFLVKLTNDDMLVIEVKGLMRSEDRIKLHALEQWCREVTAFKQFGNWHCGVIKSPEEIHALLDKYSSSQRIN